MTDQNKIRLLEAQGYRPTSDGGWNGGIRKHTGDHWTGPITHISFFNSKGECIHPNSDPAPGLNRASIWCPDCGKWVVKDQSPTETKSNGE